VLLIGDMGRKGSLRDRDELQVVDDLIGQKKIRSVFGMVKTTRR